MFTFCQIFREIRCMSVSNSDVPLLVLFERPTKDLERALQTTVKVIHKSCPRCWKVLSKEFERHFECLLDVFERP